MASLYRLLRDGLGLALLRRPRSIPLDVGFAHWTVLALLGVGSDLAWHWFAVPAPHELNGYGVQSALAAGLLRLAASAVLCGVAQRRALFWTVAAWLEAAVIPVSLFGGLLHLADANSAWPVHWIGWLLGLVWWLAILLRLAIWLSPRAIAALGAGLAFIACALPWFWLDSQWLWNTTWSQDADGSHTDYREPGELDAPEATIYAQPDLLAATLAKIVQQRPDRIDLYALSFGGDASEDVFRNEVEYAERLFAQRFDAQDRSLALLNHPDSAATRPLATATNLERALLALGERMDREQDILLLYLTSHGSEDHELYLNQPPLPLDQLTPERLRAALDASGIGWRVLVISACYSGGYIEALRDPRTLVVTAASKDRASFGCGSNSDITWFGKAYLAQALNQSADFVVAFDAARTSIESWEAEDDIAASKPQIERGAQIEAQLARWREQFTPGPALPFARTDSPRKSRRR